MKKDKSNSFYKVNDGLESCTEEILAGTFVRNNTRIKLIDTPGNNDSSNNDDLHLQKLVDYLKELEEIDSIILLLKYKDRFDGKTKEYIKTLAKIFTPNEFFKNLTIIFTHFPIKPKKSDKRKKNKRYKRN